MRKQKDLIFQAFSSFQREKYILAIFKETNRRITL